MSKVTQQMKSQTIRASDLRSDDLTLPLWKNRRERRRDENPRLPRWHLLCWEFEPENRPPVLASAAHILKLKTGLRLGSPRKEEPTTSFGNF